MENFWKFQFLWSTGPKMAQIQFLVIYSHVISHFIDNLTQINLLVGKRRYVCSEVLRPWYATCIVALLLDYIRVYDIVNSGQY